MELPKEVGNSNVQSEGREKIISAEEKISKTILKKTEKGLENPTLSVRACVTVGFQDKINDF